MHVLVFPAIVCMLAASIAPVGTFLVGSTTSETRRRALLQGINTRSVSTTFRGRRPFLPRHILGAINNNDDGNSVLDLQSNSSQYGRGERHLSAVLNEGDVVAYQTGCWLVDGVTVGTDYTNTPAVAFCRIETMQIVWTHNCEHGVVRGMELVTNKQQQSGEGSAANSLRLTSNVVEFGPEQLLARFLVKWNDEGKPTSCIPLLDLENAESWIMDTE